jgi:hypothetical protein
MSRPTELSQQAVLDWVGAVEVRKGRPYAEGGAILDPVAQGDTLKARVQGTADRPYRVWARLAGGKVAEAHCSCPVGDGGRCKHVAALLLAYRDDPGGFTELEDVDANLRKRDKAELIALVKQMLRKAPELEMLLAAPVPGGKRQAAPPLDVYRRQAAAVLRSVPEYEEWAGEEASQELAAIVETGEEFEEAGDFETAVAVYQGVTAAVLDDESDLLAGDDGPDGVPGRLAAGLLRCLDREPTGSPRRESLFRSLFDLAVTFFSYIDGDDDPDFDPLGGMLDLATPAERRTLSGWAKQLRPRGGYDSEYHRHRIAKVITRIDADVLGDEGYLDVCRQAGMTREVVAKLLELGRGEEAVREVASAVGRDRLHELTRYADQLAEGGQGPAAEKLVRERAAKAEPWVRARLLEWLKERATARKDSAERLRLAGELFEIEPSLGLYREIRSLTPAADWPARREVLLRQLAKSRQPWLVIDVHLDEGDVAAALAAYKAGRGSMRAVAVAEAAEADFPAEAAAIYRKLAESQIEHRSRGAYQEACRYLQKVGELSTRAGAADEFRRYVAGLLEKHRSLRALREEAEKAKLLPELPPTAVRRKGRS